MRLYEESQTASSSSTPSKEQSSILPHFNTKSYSPNDPRQRAATDALISHIAEVMLPFSLVEAPSFKKFVNLLDSRYTVPSRKHMSTTLLTKKHEEIQTKVHKLLHETECVSLTLDLWSNRQMRGFLGITCHFIQDWSMKSLMLECKRFYGRHTAENIAQFYSESTTEYGIVGKILTTITDNAANVVKAFRLPGFASHQQVDSDSEEDEYEHDNDDVMDSVDLQDSLLHVPEHDTCFAHTLQLVVKDGFKEVGAVSNVLTKAAKIVSFVRRSIHASEILEGERRLQAKVDTRWNSELRSIQSILRVPEDKLHQVDVVQLTTYERNILEDLVEILSPFQEATDLTQGQNLVTSSFVLPCIRGLRKSLLSLSVTYNSRMLLSLKRSLDERMAKYESRDVFIYASILDPWFKLRWCNNTEEMQEIKSRFTEMAKSSQVNELNEVVATQTTDPTEPPPSKKRKCNSHLLNYIFSTETASMNTEGSHTTEAEVTDYLCKPCLSEDCDPLEFWKEQRHTYPTLQKLAKQYLSIPASSGPVERLFSVAGKIFRPDRCRLTDSVFEKLMSVKCNSHL